MVCSNVWLVYEKCSFQHLIFERCGVQLVFEMYSVQLGFQLCGVQLIFKEVDWYLNGVVLEGLYSTGIWIVFCNVWLVLERGVVFDWYFSGLLSTLTGKVLCSFTQSLKFFLKFLFFQILLNSSKSDKCSCSVPFWRVIRPSEQASAADTALLWIKLEISSFTGSMTAYTKTSWFRLPFLGGCFGRIWSQIWPSIRWVKCTFHKVS